MISKKDLGRFGESTACKYLHDSGYLIIEKNYRCLYGEIDIVASKGNILFFIEVKTRQNKKFGEPEESVDERKIKKIVLIAEHYINSNNIEDRQICFDVLSVFLSKNKFFIKHIKNIL